MQFLTGRIPCTVIVCKTIQEREYEPWAIELHETRWVKEEDYDTVHSEIYFRLNKRLLDIIDKEFPGYYK